MKRKVILVILGLFLLVGCKDTKDESVLASMDAISPSIETSTIKEVDTSTSQGEDVTVSTTRRATTPKSNLYIEIETTKKEKHKYTFVYKTYDECQIKGQEFLPNLQRVHPEIIKWDCMYVKDDKNNRFWGVFFETCDDAETTCNFYY